MDIEEILKMKLETIKEEPEINEENGVVTRHRSMSKKVKMRHVEKEATMNSLANSFGEVEQISPDMLKNTDINIRRLADEIQHYEGRQKYLARSNSPSDGGDVRWYLCKVPLGVNGKCLAEIKKISSCK
ncbi:DDHD domain-containing protein [Forsythia ovata]|uniref:DDHD domain-containing protein n=1 Tax=Forsythia ovata TaxID=205694 RepID=A0ABD1VHU5_9LAMI